MARQPTQHTFPKQQVNDSGVREGKSPKKQPTAGISNRPSPEEHHRQVRVPPRGRANE